MDDQELIGRIREGDSSAFDEIFRRHYGPLVGFASALLKGDGVAEDVVQDVLLELWRRRETIDVGESCKAYLFRSVRNRALNEIRRDNNVKRLEPAVQDVVGESRPALTDDAAGSSELERAIAQAVLALREPVRETFLLSRRDKLTYPQIAGVLGISVKTVEARMGQALRELRMKLAEWL